MVSTRDTILRRIHDTVHGKKGEEMRRKEGRAYPIGAHVEKDRNFPSESPYQEKQQIKRFRPEFFYRRRIFPDDCERAHVASLRDFASLDSLLFVRRGHKTRDRQADRQIDGSGTRRYISDLICKTFRCHPW